jgi:hypothetical protein
MKIRLFLRGIFSGFDSRELSQTEIDNCDDYELVILTPNASQWDLYDEVYADNEQRYLAWDGTVQEPLEYPKRRRLITEEDEQAEMFTFQVSGEQWEQALDEAVADVDLNFPRHKQQYYVDAATDPHAPFAASINASNVESSLPVQEWQMRVDTPCNPLLLPHSLQDSIPTLDFLYNMPPARSYGIRR